MDEKIAYDWIQIGASGGRRNRKSCEIAHEHTVCRFGKCPDDAHSFGPGFQMMEMNFELVAVDDLLRGPGDRNAGTRALP